VLLNNIISVKLYFYFYKSAAQVNQDKKKYHPGSIQTKDFTTGLFGLRIPGQGNEKP